MSPPLFCCAVQFVIPSTVPPQSGVPAEKQLPENSQFKLFYKCFFFYLFLWSIFALWPQLSRSAPAQRGRGWPGTALPQLQRNRGKRSNSKGVTRRSLQGLLAPLQRWGQWGFSRPPYSTRCRTLHTPYALPPAASPSCQMIHSSSPAQKSCPCWFPVKGRPTTLHIHLETPSEMLRIPQHCALRSGKKYESSTGLKAPLWRLFLTVDILCSVFKCTLFALPE